MDSFKDREKNFEKKFAHDEELQFKASARKNKYIGQWISKIFNYNQEQEKEYIQFDRICVWIKTGKKENGIHSIKK